MDIEDHLKSFRYVECMEITNVGNCSTFFNTDTHKKLKIFHLNIRSFLKNIDELIICLEAANTVFDLIVLTEAWLSEDTTCVALDGYELIRTTMVRNRNDGIIIYVNRSLSVAAREVMLGEVHGLTLDLTVDSTPCNILALYRTHDTDKDLFIDSLGEFYRRNVKNKTYILLGDINLNLLNSDRYVDRYLNVLTEAGFVSCVNLPTRVTAESSSCIDHMFVNHYDYDRVRAAVVHTHVTDHYSTALEITFRLNEPHDPLTKKNFYIDKIGRAHV